jgi:hypothetical protein
MAHQIAEVFRRPRLLVKVLRHGLHYPGDPKSGLSHRCHFAGMRFPKVDFVLARTPRTLEQ